MSPSRFVAKAGFELGSLTPVMMWSIDVTWGQPGLNTHLLGLGLVRATEEGQRKEEFRTVSARPPVSGGNPLVAPLRMKMHAVTGT